MLNDKTGESQYVEPHAAWFDACNQLYRADATPGLPLSLRSDGMLSGELRARMPAP